MKVPHAAENSMSSEPHLEKNKSFLDRLTSAFRSDEDAGDAKEDLIGALSEARADGLIGSDTFSMMQGALEVSSLRAYDLMVPRAQVDAVDLEKPTDEMIRTVIASGHSRMPAVEGDLDNVLGVLHAKDLLQLLLDPSRNVKSLLRPARFVPESQPLNVLLRDFKETRNHLALVIDEFGSISGLITIEDVLEEIVGEISDEYDEDEKQFIRLADGSLIFEAKILLTDFFRVIDADPTEFGKVTEEVETLAGLLLEIKGDFPRRREIIEYDDYRFQVLEIDNRRILKVKFNRISDQGKERQEE